TSRARALVRPPTVILAHHAIAERLLPTITGGGVPIGDTVAVAGGVAPAHVPVVGRVRVLTFMLFQRLTLMLMSLRRQSTPPHNEFDMRMPHPTRCQHGLRSSRIPSAAAAERRRGEMRGATMGRRHRRGCRWVRRPPGDSLE